MIEKLTAKKLREYHFDEECIKKLIEWDNYTHTYHNDLGSFFATNIENKIYSGIDALRIIYFKTDYRPSFPEKDLDLVPEYFNLTLSQYLSRQKIIAGNLFNETKGIENFINAEKQKTVELIESIKSEALYKRSKYKQESVQKREWYLNWLNEKLNNYFINKKLSDDNHLAVKITGYGNQNLGIKEQPVFYFIEDVLKENNLTPIEAIKIVEKMKGSFSPNFNNVVTPKIIEHLESLNKLSKIDATTPYFKLEATENENINKTIFPDKLAYHLFIEWHKKHEANTKNHLANYSFIIQKMKKDKLIFDIKQVAYLEFLSEMNINLLRLKPLNECSTTTKETLYFTLFNTIYTKK